MELVCEKYKETMPEDVACCKHPKEYCKFRSACMIQFASGETPGCREKQAAAAAASLVNKDCKSRKIMQSLRFDKGDGLLPAIVQDHQSNEVLMVAYINEEAWQKTLETGKAHYWSRSRNKLWLKGESSNHVQLVKEILVDCDEDTVIYRVEQLGGAACHKGYRSCFFRRVEGDGLVIKDEPVFDPGEVYNK